MRISFPNHFVYPKHFIYSRITGGVQVCFGLFPSKISLGAEFRVRAGMYPRLGPFLGIPKWRANSELQINDFRCLFWTSLLTEWFCCCNTRVCMKKSSQERFALKILLDRPKARNEVQFLLFSPKNLQFLKVWGCFKHQNPTTKPPFVGCASRDLFLVNWAVFSSCSSPCNGTEPVWEGILLPHVTAPRMLQVVLEMDFFPCART